MDIKILNKQIISFSFHFNPEIKQVNAEVEAKIQYGTPKADDDTSVLMLVQINFHAENLDDFCICLEEQITFDFGNRPANFNEEIQDLFQKYGVQIVSDDLDNALAGIGKPPVRYKDHFKDAKLIDNDNQ